MSFVLGVVVVAVSGFISLSYEILWYRAYAFVSGDLPEVLGGLLGSYLLGIAVGAFAVRVFCRDRAATGSPAQLRILAGFMFVANLAGSLVVPTVAWLATVNVWVESFALVAFVAFMFGATLPLISHFGVAPDRLAGAGLSYLYLANIVGSAAGSLMTGFVFMDVWPIHSIALFLAMVGLALAAGLLLVGKLRGRAMAWAIGVMLISVVLVAVMTPRMYEQLYEKLLYRQKFTARTRFAQVVENKNGVIAVSEDGVVFGGGVYDGAISTDLLNDRNLIVRAFAVGAMHPKPSEVLSIGLSGGAWAQVLAHMPGTDHLTVVEINPGYFQVIPKHSEVASLLANPKVEFVIDDGRRWLARHPDRTFDVIVANVTFHWRANATNLLSREFLELVRSHLRFGGLYCFNTTWSPDVMKTAFTAYPYGLRLFNFACVSDAPVEFDKERWRRVLTAYRLDGGPIFDLSQSAHRMRLETVLGLAEELKTKASSDASIETRESVLARVSANRVITDDNMASEWQKVVPYLRRVVGERP